MQTNDGEKLNRLIFAVAKGNADCLDGIYALAGGKMYAVAFSLVGRDYAEDVLHDSFIKIALFAKKYSWCDNPCGWLIKIVRNTALDFIKAKKIRNEVSEEAFYSLSSLGYSPEKRENAIMLEQAMSKLEPEERKILYLIYYLDMTVREAASELEMSKSAVQRLKEKAEARLRELLYGWTNE